MKARSRPSLPFPTLCLVTDRSYCDLEALVERVAAAVDGGVNMVQLREKDLPGGHLLTLAERLREITQGKALFLVNDRVDVALSSEADGVQLGEEAMPVPAARWLVGPRLLLGRSVHSVAGARAAQEAGADFLVVGTVFPSGSHPSAPPAGPGLLAQVRQSVSIPLLAIGGLEEGNVGQVMAMGVHGVAVISAILGQPDSRRAAHDLYRVMAAATASGVLSSEVER
ncbi:MAG: thiamine phosphate synthase [Chloroflexi bacterium]|nr:thiamine phosphate synthase [Chloroflexota bacterium]